MTPLIYFKNLKIIDIQNNPENEYFTNCENAFSDTWKLTKPMWIGLYLYEFKNIMIESGTLFFELFGEKFLFHPALWLRQKISELVEKRTTEKVRVLSS